MIPNILDNFLVLDTEAIGPEWRTAEGTLHRRRESLPFMVGGWDQSGDYWQWEWAVDLWERKPIIPAKDLKEIRSLIGSYRNLVFHNAAFDIRALGDIGIDLRHRYKDVHDTMLLTHVLHSSWPKGLKPLSEILLGIPADDEHDLKVAIERCRRAARKQGLPLGVKHGKEDDTKGSNTTDYFLPREIEGSDLCARYNLLDCKRTALLLHHLWPELVANTPGPGNNVEWNAWESYELERSVIPALVSLGTHGLTIRPRKLKEKRAECEAQAADSASRAYQAAKALGCEYDNVGSYPQTKKLLFDHLGLPVLKSTGKGQPSVDMEVLVNLYEEEDKRDDEDAEEVVNLLNSIIRARKFNTYKGYLEGYALRMVKGSDGIYRLYPGFHPVGTGTTRFSSTNPNGQNVGKEPDEITGFSMRSVFGPPRGYIWLCMDYSQLELRIIAVRSGEQRLIDAFKNGDDVHMVTAEAFGLTIDPRQGGKRINYAVNYGAGQGKMNAIARAHGGSARTSNPMAEAYPDLSAYIRETTEYARKNGFIVTLGGYVLELPDREKAYVGTNYDTQGAAGVILKRAMARTQRYIDANRKRQSAVRMIATIHDELIFEVDTRLMPDYRQVAHGLATEMQRAGKDYGITTPVDVSVVRTSWDRGVELKPHKN